MSITRDLQSDSHLSVEDLLNVPIFKESLVSIANLSTIPDADSLNDIISYVLLYLPPSFGPCLPSTAMDKGSGSH